MLFFTVVKPVPWARALERGNVVSVTVLKPRAHAGQHLGHVPYEIVIDLTVVEHEHATAASTQERIDHVETETREPVPVLDEEPAMRRIGRRLEQLATRAVQPGADLRDDRMQDPALGARLFEQPELLPVEIRLLLR